ncbi:hypothetical protein P280DRAFT_493592 [Massarina eburnea CBS 473.64]|uniref:Gfd2/YDR514C-like C-terminal domain-containing protein n=1 Tax=Massarina eburnea CBS 473.64 TaxID=1395130 RepID=A0A6A6RKT1_9PLEO|nr:hypothetical protein P280DRAFT_493592 [Massarina eburnea CBS 473.64]
MHPDTTILRHFLGGPGILPMAPEYLATSAIICLNLEWWQKEPHPTTEIGIAEFFPSTTGPSMHAANHLSNIRIAHARIMPHAHLENQFSGAGKAEDLFYFGTTKYITLSSARDILTNTLLRTNTAGQKQPIILLLHGAEAKLAHLKNKLGVDVAGLGTVVKILDTQTLAKQANIPAQKGAMISLADLSRHFNIAPVNHHNAGNAAAYTIMCGILATLKHEIYGKYLPATGLSQVPPTTILGRSMGDVVGSVMRANRNAPVVPWGTEVFCTRCDGLDHLVGMCMARVLCEECLGSGDPRKVRAARTHKVEKCVFRVRGDGGGAMDLSN